MSDKHDPSIQIVPPILGTKEAPNPRYVDLTMEVEVFLNHDKYDEEVTEAERVQYNFWTVANSVCDQLHHMIQFNEVGHWPVALRGQEARGGVHRTGTRPCAR